MEFQFLVLLAESERHGWAILQEAVSVGRVIPGSRTLHRTLQRLETDGLLERRRELEDGEERRRVYRLTPLGRVVASTEARRLQTLLGVAQAATCSTRWTDRDDR